MKRASSPTSLAWAICFLLKSFTLGCPNIGNVECFCENMFGVKQTCYNVSTREIVFKADPGYRRNSLQCWKEELLDDFYETTIPEQLDTLKIDGCMFTKKWTAQFFNSTIRTLSLKETNPLNFDTNILLLKTLKQLRVLTLDGFAQEFINKFPFEEFELLKRLTLVGNNLANLSIRPFASLQKLTYLSLEKNHLLKQPFGLLSGLYEVRFLMLINNNVKMLSDDTFSDLPQMALLHLEENELETLPEKLLWQNRELNVFRLLAQRLIWLPHNLLRNVKGLKKLYIIDSPLIQIPYGFLNNQSNLKEIYIENCNLSSIPENLFEGAPALEVLNLGNNKLNRLTNGYFKKNILLKKLNVSSNEIVNLIESPFQNNRDLGYLDLSRNRLRNITRQNFLGLSSLSTLKIHNNVLTDIKDNTFADLKILMELDLNNNSLTSVKAMCDSKIMPRLLDLRMNDNKVTELPDLHDCLTINDLWLERNLITSITVKKMNFSTAYSIHVHLKYNHITSIDVNSLEIRNHDNSRTVLTYSSGEKVLFHLSKSSLKCDCTLFNLYRYVLNIGAWIHFVSFYSFDSLECNSPQNLKGKIIVNLQKENFTCPVKEKCPKGCTCVLREVDHVVIINCKGQEMKTLPETVPDNVAILNVEDNNITEFGMLRRDEWQNVTEIYADGNYLTSNDSDQWFIPHNLQILSLRRNQLTALPEPIKIHAERMQNFQVYLSNNSWRCDCSAVQFKEWLSAHSSQVKDIKEVMCLKESEDGGEPLMEQLMQMTHDELCPADLSHLSKRLIMISSFSVSAAIVAILPGVIVYYRKKKLITVYLYNYFPSVFLCLCKHKDIDSDKIFDAFVSYSGHDRDVTLQLINELEQNAPFYRLCIHERDWIPGRFITDNIQSSVENCRKTILILSQNFLNSAWFDTEFHAAYYQMMEDRIDRLIVIIRGELPPKGSLNKDLQFFLSTKTYLEWGEKWFWEKLRYAMPHYVHGRAVSTPKKKSPGTEIASRIV